MENNLIGWTTKWTVKDAAAFKAACDETSSAVAASEPATVLYEWFMSDDKKTASIHEWFVGNQGAKIHAGGVAVTKFMPQIMAAADVTEMHVFGDVDDELRAGLAAWNPASVNGHVGGFNRMTTIEV